MVPPKLTILRQYASKSNSATLPKSVLFSHSESTITIFDAFPKAIFHFLILPRPNPPFTVGNLSSLRSLLLWDKSRARECILNLQKAAQETCTDIESEMMARYGFKW